MGIGKRIKKQGALAPLDREKKSEIEQQTGLIVEAQDIIFKDREVAKKLANYILHRGSIV